MKPGTGEGGHEVRFVFQGLLLLLLPVDAALSVDRGRRPQECQRWSAAAAAAVRLCSVVSRPHPLAPGPSLSPGTEWSLKKQRLTDRPKVGRTGGLT